LAILAALGGALFVGSADFLGGLAARSTQSILSTLCVNSFALVLFALAWIAIRPHLDADVALLALAAGLVNAVGLNLIYASFAAGAMSLAAPIIACGSALVPTVTTAIAGEPPSALQSFGIVWVLIGVLAITLMPSSSPDHVPLSRRVLALTTFASLVGGASFAMLLLATRHGDSAAAVGVASLSRLSSTSVCLLLAVFFVRGRHPSAPSVRPIIGAGIFEFCGTILFLIASTMGNSSVVAVIVSLYAIVTVLLAQTVLRERIAVHQLLGIVAAAIGIALLSLG
jgi:drug/metabolite transporter (DMT)-like permease